MANLGGSASSQNEFYFANQASVILEREQQPPTARKPYDEFWNRIFDVDRPGWRSEVKYPSTSSFEWESWNSDAEAGAWVRDHLLDCHVGDEFWGGIDCVGSKENGSFKHNQKKKGRIFYFIEIKSKGWNVNPGWRSGNRSDGLPGPSTSITIGLNQLNEYQHQLKELKASGLPSLNEREPYMAVTSAFLYYLLMFTQRIGKSTAGRQVYLVRPEHILYGADGKPHQIGKGRRGGMVSVSRTRLGQHVAAGNLVKKVDANTVFDGHLSYYTPAYASCPEFSLMPITSNRTLLRSSIDDAFATETIEPEDDYPSPEEPW